MAAAPAAAAVVHAPVAGDVLDHHDGVIDQDADGEDQREQRDPVQRVAHDPGGKERQQDGHRDHDGHHDRFAPADGEQHQRDDRDGGKAEVEQKLVGLFVRGFAVVAGDLDRRCCRGSAGPPARRPGAGSSSATTTALAPARLAMASVTAGRALELAIARASQWRRCSSRCRRRRRHRPHRAHRPAARRAWSAAGCRSRRADAASRR